MVIMMINLLGIIFIICMLWCLVGILNLFSYNWIERDSTPLYKKFLKMIITGGPLFLIWLFFIGLISIIFIIPLTFLYDLFEGWYERK